MNLQTLAAMGITYPSQKWWASQIRDSIEALGDERTHGDLKIHNLIVSANKLHWIDTDHHGGRRTILKDIEGMVKDV